MELLLLSLGRAGFCEMLVNIYQAKCATSQNAVIMVFNLYSLYIVTEHSKLKLNEN
jgi:c-di-GMP-related signal transduction protein